MQAEWLRKKEKREIYLTTVIFFLYDRIHFETLKNATILQNCCHLKLSTSDIFLKAVLREPNSKSKYISPHGNNLTYPQDNFSMSLRKPLLQIKVSYSHRETEQDAG